MPQDTPCEKCHRVGLVYLERIITGTQVTLSYYCAGCEHLWQKVTPDPRPAIALTLTPKRDRRKLA